MKKSKFFRLSDMVYSALCVALCVVLPQVFHMIPNFGSLFSPMHIPVLLCGLLCGWHYGLLCGILGPLLSSVITSMPPMAYLPPMLVECAVYGFAAGLLIAVIRTKYVYVNLYISLTAAMILGRIAAGTARALIFAPGTLTFPAFITAYFIETLPGIITHLILIPTMVVILQKVRGSSHSVKTNQIPAGE